MADREKAIKGLECCLPMTMRNGLADCKQCPYDRKITLEGGIIECCHDLMADTLALLKAQEPRILTVSEIGALANGDVVWVEFTDGRLLPMMVEDGCLVRWRFMWRICEDAFCDEDYRARAWTSRPTDEQRRGTPWN